MPVSILQSLLQNHPATRFAYANTKQGQIASYQLRILLKTRLAAKILPIRMSSHHLTTSSSDKSRACLSSSGSTIIRTGSPATVVRTIQLLGTFQGIYPVSCTSGRSARQEWCREMLNISLFCSDLCLGGIIFSLEDCEKSSNDDTVACNFLPVFLHLEDRHC